MSRAPRTPSRCKRFQLGRGLARHQQRESVCGTRDSEKKKSDKDCKSKGSSKAVQPKAPEPQMFWAPAHLVAKSWADVDDEDDDDYYATKAPPHAAWGSLEPQQIKVKPNLEESQSEEDILDKGDDDAEEKHDHTLEPAVKKPADVPAPPKEAERRLSKKERKKKELAELEALSG